MASARVKTLRRAYEAWSSGDLDALRAVYTRDVTADAGPLWPTSGEMSGVEPILEAFASILETFESSEIIPETFIERGSTVVVPTRWRGTLAGSGVIEQRLVAAYTFRRSRVCHIGYFKELDEALADVDRRNAGAPAG